MPTVEAHGHLIPVIGREPIRVTGRTVAEALASLIAQFPRVRDLLLTRTGALSDMVSIGLRDRIVGLDAPVRHDDVLILIGENVGGAPE